MKGTTVYVHVNISESSVQKNIGLKKVVLKIMCVTSYDEKLHFSNNDIIIQKVCNSDNLIIWIFFN